MKTIFILGTDRRFDEVAKRFLEEGFHVLRQGHSQEPAVYLFSLGERAEGIIDQLRFASEGSFAFVGRGEDSLRRFAAEKKITLVPLLEDGAYLRTNAIATAEGALAKVIECTPRLLGECCVLICGYGNCGKALARLFWLAGCEVWVFSREGSMKRAAEDGFNTYRAPGDRLGMFDVILNTVPAPIFTPEMLSAIPSGTLLFQIASGSSGLDPHDLKERGIHFHPLPGLPGKVAPETEADAIYRVMRRHLFHPNQERSESN